MKPLVLTFVLLAAVVGEASDEARTSKYALLMTSIDTWCRQCSIFQNPVVNMLNGYPLAEIQWLCSVLAQAAELDFTCTDGLSSLSCSPLLHDILGLARPIPPAADVRDARDQILERLYNEIDEEEARGDYSCGRAMSRSRQRLLVVKAAASVLLERATSQNKSTLMARLWHTYTGKFVSGLPDSMIMRMLRRVLDILYVHIARLPSPMSSRRIVEHVCGRQHHEEL
jgi:hypothetical protein